MAADEGFDHIQGHSTTHIFFKDVEGHERVLRLQPGVPPPQRPYGLDPMPTLCSSSKGLVALRTPTSKYYIGNPLIEDEEDQQYEDDDDDEDNEQEDEYMNVEEDEEVDVGSSYDHGSLPDPPRHPHATNRTQVVLAIHKPSGSPSLVWHMVCALRTAPFTYTFETHTSQNDSWKSFNRMKNIHRTIEPNSGVSCGSFVYWLTRKPLCSVLKFDPEGKSIDDSTTILDLPPHEVVDGDERMQLGRIGNRLGLVIASVARSNIELYTLQEENENSWTVVEVFKLEVRADHGFEEWREEDWSVVCREMPTPIRFESFKVELLFWVHGRVIRFENSSIDPRRYRLTSVDIPVTDHVIDGIPHVGSLIHPRQFTT